MSEELPDRFRMKPTSAKAAIWNWVAAKRVMMVDFRHVDTHVCTAQMVEAEDDLYIELLGHVDVKFVTQAEALYGVPLLGSEPEAPEPPLRKKLKRKKLAKRKKLRSRPLCV